MGVVGRRQVIKHVIVRRTGTDGEKELNDLSAAVGFPATIDRSLDSRQTDFSDLRYDSADADDDDDDDDDEYQPSPTLAITMPMPPPPTGSLALGSRPATNTVAVQISPPTREAHSEGKGGLSSTTQHLLIAAGSIGGTIILVMVILAMYTMRKRNLTFRQALDHGRAKISWRGSPPTPPKGESWDTKVPYDASYGSMRRNSVTPPQRVMSMSRSGSNSSQRPLMALQRSDSFKSKSPQTAISTEPVQQSSFLDSPSPRHNLPLHRRNTSETPSSPVLPLQNNQRRSESTRDTDSVSEGSDLRFPEPPTQRNLSPLPPPPTFKQFLDNRPSVSQNRGPGAMVSRFSWTNSNAPQTPHDPSRDTATQIVGRDSYMTQRSSVPRFRTIDSWVDQQANRIEEQKLREQYRLTQSSTDSAVENAHPPIPEVPEIPEAIARTAPRATSQANTGPEPPPPMSPLPPPGLAGRSIQPKHERHDTRTTVETAPIFRAHPGTEVRFSTRSAVPSEILDAGRVHNVLS